MLARNVALHWLLAGLIGVAVGFLIRPQSSVPPIRAYEPSATDVRAAPDWTASRPELGLVDGGALTRSGTARADVPFTVSDTALDRAVAALEAPIVAEVAAGEGRIVGRVTDRRGAPLGGVAILAQRRLQKAAHLNDPTEVAKGSFEDESLEVVLRARATAWAENRSQKRSTTSRADGRFELDGLAAQDEYTISARLDGHVVQSVGDVSHVVAGSEVQFIGYAVAVVRVDVVDESGERLNEGAIEVRRGKQAQLYAWSPQKSELRLEAGAVELRAFAELGPAGALDARLASSTSTLRVDERSELELVLTVAARTGVRGRVTQGNPPTQRHVSVRLASLPSGADFSNEVLTNSQRISWVTSNQYSFLDLAPGRFAIGVLDQQNKVLTHSIIEVTDGILEFDLTIESPPAEQMLTLRALDPSGQPLLGFDATLEVRTEDSRHSMKLQAVSWANGAGTFVLPKEVLDSEKDKEEFNCTIDAQHPAYGAAEVELERHQREVLVQFHEPVGIDVVVEGLATSGLFGRLSVSVDPVVEESDSANMYWYGASSQRSLPADGRLSFPMLAPGTYEVKLYFGLERWGASVLERREIDVAVGTSEVVFVSPTLHRVRVVAPGVVEGNSVWLSPHVENGGRQMRGMYGGGFGAKVGANGRAQFEDVPAGEYTLSAGSVSTTMRITVPCADILFEGREPDALRVTISDIEGLLHRAGLRSGDLIIAVNGNDPAHAGKLQQALYSEPDERPVDVTVRRDGASHTFTIPASETNRRRALGGSLRAVLRES